MRGFGLLFLTEADFSSEDRFCCAKSVDPNEKQLYAAFHLVLHSLFKCPFRGFMYTKS